MAGGEPEWRKSILNQLNERNKFEIRCFQDLINQHNRLFDIANTLKSENLQLTVQNEKLRVSSFETNVGTEYRGSVSSGTNERVQQRLLSQQEELTDLHRRIGEKAQQIINLNAKLLESEKALASKEECLNQSKATIATLELDTSRLHTSLKELKLLEQHLRDEYQALQITCAALEEKLRKAQDENRQLVERLIKYKSKDADKMNEENENFLKIRGERMRRELEDAAREGPGSATGSEDRVSLGSLDLTGPSPSSPFYNVELPSKASVTFDAHDAEVNAVKWCPTDRLIATGGADRKVKLWDVSKGGCENRGILVGSNAGVMSVDFDATGTLILGASNDFASRVWTISDQRLRHTLTGHSGKVMAAKFLGEPSKVITGSHDRTLKIWDLRSRACVETKFAGSSCNDLVTSDGAGTTIISGHFDKSIRFWDIRTDSTANHIMLQGKVTSLDLSRDCNYLLACVRDDTIQLLDLRMNTIVGSFSHDSFKVGCDWARAAFSPDGRHVAVGGADGSVFIWGVTCRKIESILKEHTAAVSAVTWHPHGGCLVSVDRSKKAILWGDM
ncbi:autophagy-related 16 isoform X2 [Arctopsyche grandis]|uniref:autophagy-related 16 isoform X2 n=1 Tax=Arctopsyche grandis TaxID=121162 RepID=UPI00406D84D4